MGKNVSAGQRVESTAFAVAGDTRKGRGPEGGRPLEQSNVAASSDPVDTQTGVMRLVGVWRTEDQSSGHRHGAGCQRDPSLAASPPGAHMTSVLAGGPSEATTWFTMSGGLT